MPEPIILGTWTFARWGNDAAWPALAAGGSAIDAVERATNIAESDPRVDSVGKGGMPDATGQVVLDAAIMESPLRWGSVLSVRNYENPASIARRLMDRFGRAMRAAEGAELFAREEGFRTSDLLIDRTREWFRTRHDPAQKPTLAAKIPVGILDTNDGRLHLSAEEARLATINAGHDTVGVVALDRAGQFAACTSTSGTPLKPLGRIGDSAIPGHGLACEQGLGAVVATGAGELISSVGASQLALEALRAGRSPQDAIRHALDRLTSATPTGAEPQAALLVLGANGAHAAGALRPGFFYAITSTRGTQVLEPHVVAHR